MVYTAIFGNRDAPRDDIHVFTNSLGMGSPRLDAKIYKVLSHLFFRQITCWVDGNIFPKYPKNNMWLRLLGGSDLAVFKHPDRSTVKEECDVVETMGFNVSEIKKDFGSQLDRLPLYECSILIRAYNNRVIRFNEIWWSLICRYSVRDQLTIPIAISQVPGLKVAVVSENPRKHPDFNRLLHTGEI